jgi:hypothetical protein
MNNKGEIEFCRPGRVPPNNGTMATKFEGNEIFQKDKFMPFQSPKQHTKLLNVNL